MTTPHDGMTQVFSDDFSYSGSPPVDPSKWFIGDPRPGNVGFGNAKFLLAGDSNIGLILTGGGGSPLQINACYNSGGFTVPGGTSDWISALISTAWDSSGSIAGVGVRRGYFEVVMTVPVDALEGGGGGSGTWIGFWLMQFPTILGTGPTMEIDTELYGVSNNQFPATSQWWPTDTTVSPTNAHPTTAYRQSQVGGTSGLPTVSDFQGTSTTFGMLVDDYNVTWFVDGVQQCIMPLMVPESTDPFFLMIDLGMGGGWPIVPPTSPATSYPLILTSANIWDNDMTTVTGVTSLSVSPTSSSDFSITYSTGGGSPPAPTITPASSPTTSGSAVTIGTTSPGTGGDTLTVTLTTDTIFSSGSSLALTGGSAPYNISYTPGTITSNTTTDLTYTVNDTTNSTSTTETAQAVGLTVSSGAIALVTSGSIAGSATGGTSSALNTTGATLLVIVDACQNGSTPSDSKSNTWHLAIDASPTGEFSAVDVWYAWNPAVGTGHTFTNTPNYSESQIMAFSGVQTSSDPLDSPTSSSTTTGTPGSVTPTNNGSLLITGVKSDNPGDIYTIGSSFTISGQTAFSTGVNFGGAAAYLVQTTAAASNPTWNVTPSGTFSEVASVQCVFIAI